MTREEYKTRLEEKSNKLWEFIDTQKGLIRLYERIIKKLEKDVDEATDEIAYINDELDIINNLLGGYNELHWFIKCQ